MAKTSPNKLIQPTQKLVSESWRAYVKFNPHMGSNLAQVIGTRNQAMEVKERLPFEKWLNLGISPCLMGPDVFVKCQKCGALLLKLDGMTLRAVSVVTIDRRVKHFFEDHNAIMHPAFKTPRIKRVIRV